MSEKTILVVEDDLDIQSVLVKRLRDAGFCVYAASNGKHAYAIIECDPPDLVILDLMLPGMPGEEVCRRMRKHKEYMKIPVIMLTAKTAEVDSIVGRVIGADHYMHKPFDHEELLGRVKQLLADKS